MLVVVRRSVHGSGEVQAAHTTAYDGFNSPLQGQDTQPSKTFKKLCVHKIREITVYKYAQLRHVMKLQQMRQFTKGEGIFEEVLMIAVEH